jgi:hypothetical protein
MINPMFGPAPRRKAKWKPLQRRNMVRMLPAPRLVLVMCKH